MSSVRESLACLCHELLHSCYSTETKIDSNNTSAAEDTSNIIHSSTNTLMKSIVDNFERNPYAIFTLDPKALASHLNVSIDKIQNIRKRASGHVLEDQTIGTFGNDVLCNGNDITVPSSNMLLDLYKQSTSFMRTRETCRYISTGSSHLDQFLKNNGDEYNSTMNLRKRSGSFEKDYTPIVESYIAHGGLPFGKVSQIVGPCASGKTQVALSLSSHAILFHNSKCNVHFIVGGGGNSSLLTIARRFKSISSALLNHKKDQAEVQKGRDDGRYDEVMHRFEVLPVSDGFMLLNRLHRIESDLRNRITENQSNFSYETHLVVVDSIVGCISSLIWGEGDGGVGASLLNEIGLSLRRLSRVTDFSGFPSVAVLVTNNMSTNRSSMARNVALGDAWRAADLTFILEPQPSESILKTHPIGSPLAIDKIITARYYGHSERDEEVEFRINFSGVTNV